MCILTTLGALLANAGLMLLELVTKPPFKMLAMWGKHATLAGDMSPDVASLQALCVAGVAMNLLFVVMTKMHWNFTENTGRALPKA